VKPAKLARDSESSNGIKSADRKRTESLAALRIAEAMLVRIWNEKTQQAKRCLNLARVLATLAVDIHDAEERAYGTGYAETMQSEEEAGAAVDSITEAAMKAISDTVASDCDARKEDCPKYLQMPSETVAAT
jgi:hypothetical protein